MDRFKNNLLMLGAAKLQLPLLTLVLLLQRSPILKVLIDRQFSLAPKAAHLLKWITGSSIVVGGVNTVTGATASVKLLDGFNNTEGTLGEYFRISFASTAYTVGSYKLGTAAPPGLALSPTVNEFGVGTIDGIPARAGVYNLDIWAYKEDNHTGDSTLLAVTVYILESGPNITDHPNSASLQWGAPLNLSVSLQSADGASYQWQKDGVDIPGATFATYQVSQAVSSDEGVYQVVVTQDGEATSSDPASVSINASGLQVWKEQAFGDPFSENTNALNDPDQDGLNNFVEYSIGSDPEIPTIGQFPTMARESRIGKNYVSYTYPKNPNATDLTIHADYVDSLKNVAWVQIYDFLNGIRLEESSTELKVLVPPETVCFVRFRISGPEINN